MCRRQGWTAFRLEQLEARVLSLDSLRVSWLKEAAQREEKRRQELLACRLHDDITQVSSIIKPLSLLRGDVFLNKPAYKPKNSLDFPYYSLYELILIKMAAA